MQCPDCHGKGTRALHGIALTSDDLADWDPEEIEDYVNGKYDTECDMCGGTGQVESDEAVDDYRQDYRTFLMESGLYGEL